MRVATFVLCFRDAWKGGWPLSINFFNVNQVNKRLSLFNLVGEEGQSGAAGITWACSTGSLLVSTCLLTSDEVLLGWAVDASQVAVVLPAVLLGVLPRVSPAEVTVAVAVELPPGVVAALGVWVGVRNTAVSH